METNNKLFVAPKYCFSAYVDIDKTSKTQVECLALLYTDYKSTDRCQNFLQYDFISPDLCPESALLQSLVDDYSLPISGINYPLPDEIDSIDEYDDISFNSNSSNHEYGFHLKFPITCQAPFTLFCNFLAIDFKKFIPEFVDNILDSSQLYEPSNATNRTLLQKKYTSIVNLFLLDDEIESFLELAQLEDFQNLSRKEAKSYLIQMYESYWFDYILLQKYCMAYINNPKKYGTSGHFEAFRHRYQILDYSFCNSKMPNDASTEKNLLFHSYTNNDLNKFDIVFHQFTKNIPSLNKKTIVASRFSVLLADMLEMIINNRYTIKKCKLCGQYFVPMGNNNIEYCSRIYTDKETCREIGPKKYSQDKLKNDKVRNEIKKIYNRLRNQKNRHPEQLEYTKKFEEFNRKRKQLEHAYRTGKLSESEIIHALDTWKAR